MHSEYKPKKPLPILVLCAVLAGGITFGTVKLATAYFHNAETHKNSYGVANNVIEIREEFTPPPAIDVTSEYKKSVSVKNTGDVPVYARVLITWSDPYAEKDSEITNAKGTFAAEKLSENLPDGWVKSPGGKFGTYFYYTKSIAPGESTNEIIQKVKTTFAEGSEKYDYDIYVMSESVQTKRTVGTETKDLTWQEAWEGFIQE